VTDSAHDLSPPLSLKGLLDGALQLLRHHLRSLYLPFAIPLVLVMGLTTLSQLNLTYPAGGGHAPPTTQFMVTMIVAFVSWVLYGLVYLAMVVTATDIVGGRPVSLRRSWMRVVDPRFLGTQILAWMAILGGTVFCLLPILPGIYVFLVLSLVVPVMAAESRFGLAPIRRSWRLMSHNPRRQLSADPRVRAFLLYFAGTLIGQAIGMLVSLPAATVMFILMFRAAAQGQQADPDALMRQMVWIQVPGNMVGMLVQTLVFLYMAFGLALLYADVRKRKEGPDLLAAAERLAERAPQGSG
jgi:hypothetical protein